MKIDIFDTTLRDGFQQEGISPSVKDKLEIAKLLDNLGVSFIRSEFERAASIQAKRIWVGKICSDEQT